MSVPAVTVQSIMATLDGYNQQLFQNRNQVNELVRVFGDLEHELTNLKAIEIARVANAQIEQLQSDLARAKTNYTSNAPKARAQKDIDDQRIMKAMYEGIDKIKLAFLPPLPADAPNKDSFELACRDIDPDKLAFLLSLHPSQDQSALLRALVDDLDNILMKINLVGNSFINRWTKLVPLQTVFESLKIVCSEYHKRREKEKNEYSNQYHLLRKGLLDRLAKLNVKPSPILEKEEIPSEKDLEQMDNFKNLPQDPDPSTKEAEEKLGHQEQAAAPAEKEYIRDSFSGESGRISRFFSAQVDKFHMLNAWIAGIQIPSEKLGRNHIAKILFVEIRQVISSRIVELKRRANIAITSKPIEKRPADELRDLRVSLKCSLNRLKTIINKELGKLPEDQWKPKVQRLAVILQPSEADVKLAAAQSAQPQRMPEEATKLDAAISSFTMYFQVYARINQGLARPTHPTLLELVDVLKDDIKGDVEHFQAFVKGLQI